MKVLLTGAQGYIGSVLGPFLLARGHDVVGLDSGFFAADLLYPEPEVKPPVRALDVRETRKEDFEGVDAVVHMAALSNDPLGQLLPDLTRQINFRGALRTALAAREAGVKRFIDFSSCSVYGLSGDGARTESCPTGPLTEYARCKVFTETALSELSSPGFCVVSMRNSTVFGPSPRMRFDLVLNNLAGSAWTTGEIRLISDGTPWRPLIHVRDLARAVALILEAPEEEIRGQVFNVGDDRMNCQVRDIASAVARAFPGCRLQVGDSQGDNRSYRVSFAKIRERLGFECEYDLDAGAKELRELFERCGLTQAQFQSASFTRLKRIRALRESGALDENLFWLTGSPHDPTDAQCAVSA